MALIGRLPVSWGFWLHLEAMLWKPWSLHTNENFLFFPSLPEGGGQVPLVLEAFPMSNALQQWVCSQQLSQNDSTVGHLNGNGLPYLSHWELVKENALKIQESPVLMQIFGHISMIFLTFPSCSTPSSSYCIRHWSLSSILCHTHTHECARARPSLSFPCSSVGMPIITIYAQQKLRFNGLRKTKMPFITTGCVKVF